MNTTSVEAYLREGCGRCEHYKSPQCKVHLWTDTLAALRALLRRTALTETLKWGAPCYTHGGKNVVMLVALRDYCGLSFFKGAGLTDPEGVLERPGPNSRLGRVLKVKTAADVTHRTEAIQGLIAEAIALEQSGKTVTVEAAADPAPEELLETLDADLEFKQAFEALTPGRQRSHILYIGGGKQTATRRRRVARCRPKVMAGKGFNER